MKKLNSLLIIGTVSTLVACGGMNKSNIRTGKFLDSPVINIGYRTETQEGMTNASGEYHYLDGELVTFFIGDLELPTVKASGTVTPLDMSGSIDTSVPETVNILRLLQSIDEDGDPTNGITISKAAQKNATPVIFDSSVSEFESSEAVTNLISSAEAKNTILISQNAAIDHFEKTLLKAHVKFVANASIVGTWVTGTTDSTLLTFMFFEDGTYTQMEFSEGKHTQKNGMEWGSYTKNNETGLLTTKQKFDSNGVAGLSDIATVTAQVAGDALTLIVQKDLAEVITKRATTLAFTRVTSDDLLGSWINDKTETSLQAFTYLKNGDYIHLKIDLNNIKLSGMELGEYNLNNDSHLLTVKQMFDENGKSGLSDAGEIFTAISNDMLTYKFASNTDVIGDELTFKRQ